MFLGTGEIEFLQSCFTFFAIRSKFLSWGSGKEYNFLVFQKKIPQIVPVDT